MPKEKTNIEKSILETLAYYRILKTPLTLIQIGRYLFSGKHHRHCQNLSEIKEILGRLKEDGKIIEQKGLYWLNLKQTNKVPAQNSFPEPKYATWLKYIKLEKFAQIKINKIRKSLKILKLIPFLRGIFVCGSVSRKVCGFQSDIDFLILTAKNRTWTVRFMLTVFAWLVGKKTKNTGTRKDKFCLNHYRSSSKLKLEDKLRDLYSAGEYSRMINLYSVDHIERKFFKKNKRWIKEFLPNFNFSKLPLYFFENKRSILLRKKIEKMLSGKIGNIIDKLLYYLQSGKIAFSQNSSFSSQRRIITEREVIMFHLNPRAPKALNRYRKLCQNLTLQ